MTRDEIFATYPEIAMFLNREVHIKLDTEKECEELGRIFDGISENRQIFPVKPTVF